MFTFIQDFKPEWNWFNIYVSYLKSFGSISWKNFLFFHSNGCYFSILFANVMKLNENMKNSVTLVDKLFIIQFWFNELFMFVWPNEFVTFLLRWKHVLVTFQVNLYSHYFCDYLKKGSRPKLTIYKHESDKSKKCLSVSNFGILFSVVVCSLKCVCSIHKLM